MRYGTLAVLALFLLAIPAVAFDEPQAQEKPSLRLSGILNDVGVEDGTVVIEFGRNVDAALEERRAERGGTPVLGRDRSGDDPGGSAGLLRASITEDAELTISFRDAPSVGNNLPRSLKELRDMKGWPASVDMNERNGRPVVTRVIVWR